MFVSDEYMVLFDPHMKYLGDGKATTNNPGKRIKFTSK